MKKNVYKVAVVSEAGVVENIVLAPEGHEVPGPKTLIILGTMYNDTDMVPIHKGRLPHIGDLWDGAAFTEKPPTAKELQDYLAKVRYGKEISGITFQGTKYPTKREFRTALSEIMSSGLPNTGKVCIKAAGEFHAFPSLVQVAELQRAIADHVQLCFAKEMEVLDKIKQGLVTKYTEINQSF